jgi:D-xylose transport system permease protein
MILKDNAIAALEQPAERKARARAPANWKRLLGLQEAGVFYALVFLIATLSVITTFLGQSNYLTITNLSNVVYQSSLTAMMAVAMTVVLISGNFDLSVASVAAFAAAMLIGNADLIGFWPALALAMASALALGLLNGVIVQYVGINAFIVTLGTMTAVRGAILLYTDGRSLAVSNPDVIEIMKAFESGKHNGFWVVLAIGALLAAFGARNLLRERSAATPTRPSSLGMVVGGAALLLLALASGGDLPMRNPVIYLAIFTFVVWFFLKFTRFGRRVYAVGGNPEAARLSGINVTRYKLLAFVFCSGVAGFAGILFASRLRAINPSGLQGAELTVIASAILGGTSLFGGAGSVIKTLAGALLLFSLTNGFNILNLGANWQGLIEGTVVITAAAIYTVGGRKSRSKTSG